MYNSNNGHELILRENSYNLNKKILTIHSEDRDIGKWPHSTCFEIQCPQVYQNVESIRLIDITLPTIQYTFTHSYQNTIFLFKFIPFNTTFFPLLNNNTIYSFEIQEGNYTGTQLALEIQNNLNNTISIASGIPYINFKVYYDPVANILHYGNPDDYFSFLFNLQPTYVLTHCEQPNIFAQYTRWGLGWNLGFNQETYDSINLLNSNGDTSIVFNYLVTSDPNYTFLSISDTITQGFYLKSPMPLKLQPDTAIYLEIEKFNYLDELVPYVCFTNEIYTNASYNGVINSAFIKIPLIPLAPSSVITNYVLNTSQIILNNCGFCIPVIEKISKFKFKFRYHDGRLVDFKDYPFNFSLEINQIRNEIPRSYNVRKPN
jgi:hypothetical protein